MTRSWPCEPGEGTQPAASTGVSTAHLSRATQERLVWTHGPGTAPRREWICTRAPRWTHCMTWVGSGVSLFPRVGNQNGNNRAGGFSEGAFARLGLNTALGHPHGALRSACPGPSSELGQISWVVVAAADTVRSSQPKGARPLEPGVHGERAWTGEPHGGRTLSGSPAEG